MEKMNLISMVQDIIESLGSEPVNSITDTSEAYQIATFVKNTYNNLLTNRDIPDFETLVKIVAWSDNRFPTFLHYPEGIKDLKTIWYNVGEDHVHYKEILFVPPEDFLHRCNYGIDDTVEVIEPFSGTTLYLRNNTDPSYWTTFDNENIIFDAYDKKKDATIQARKLRALGSMYPEFKMEDTFVPKLHVMYFPMLLNEAKSTAFSLLKGYVDPKVEQMARRQRFSIQNDKFIDNRASQWNDYGRNGPSTRRNRVHL